MPGLLYPTGRLWTPNLVHPACQGLRFWWKADGRQALFDRAQRQAFTLTGSPTLGRDDKIGDFQTFPSGAGYTGAAYSAYAMRAFAFGIIFIPHAVSGNEQYFKLPPSGAFGGLEVYGAFQFACSQTGTSITITGNNFSPGISLGTPYFIACTGFWNDNFAQIDGIAVNLGTGAVSTVASASQGTGGAPAGTNSGACYVGWNGSTNNALADISAIVLGSNYIGPRGLRLWSQDPWGPWGAPQLSEWEFSLPGSGGAVFPLTPPVYPHFVTRTDRMIGY